MNKKIYENRGELEGFLLKVLIKSFQVKKAYVDKKYFLRIAPCVFAILAILSAFVFITSLVFGKAVIAAISCLPFICFTLLNI
jgi:hypothetical protein